MGAYLQKPNREKQSVDYDGELFSYGASSMQGWRQTQEDSHNCCEDFDKNTAMFAVYDGHGGAEVAQYTAMKFPDFIKTLPGYKEGNISQALEDAFLQFDESLTKDDVIQVLKELAGFTEMGEDEVQTEVAGLFEDADKPLEQLLMERYQGGKPKPAQLFNNKLKKEDILSPALKGKKDSSDSSPEEQSEDNASENLENKMNGEVDCNGEHKDTAENEPTTESTGKNGVKETQEEPQSNSDATVSTGSGVKKQEMGGGDDGGGEKAGSSTDDHAGDETVKQGNFESGEGCVSTSQQSTGSSSKDKVVTDSAQADSTTSDSAAGGSKSKSSGDSNCESEVSSSSGASGSSSVPRGSAGGSGGSSGSNSCDNEVVSGSTAAETSSPDSSLNVEPCSSTGRKRSGKSGIIPAEGEDESSFDDDSSSEGSLDSEDVVEDDSSDDVGGEDLFDDDDDEDDDDDDDDDTPIVYGQEEPGSDSGCTAVVAILSGSELYVANAGDSRCVVCRDGKAINMSFDHKPEDELELNRIVEAGGQVTPEGRVNGGLNLSRAIGDHTYKKNTDLPLKDQMITALPDVRTLTLEDKDEFMILACDGIWNSLNSQDTVNFVRDRLNGGVSKLSAICEEMFEFCLAPNTSGDGTGCDNMTAIIVKFSDKLKHLGKQTESGATKRPASSEDSSSEDTASKKVKDGD